MATLFTGLINSTVNIMMTVISYYSRRTERAFEGAVVKSSSGCAVEESRGTREAGADRSGGECSEGDVGGAREWQSLG